MGEVDGVLGGMVGAVVPSDKRAHTTKTYFASSDRLILATTGAAATEICAVARRVVTETVSAFGGMLVGPAAAAEAAVYGGGWMSKVP